MFLQQASYTPSFGGLGLRGRGKLNTVLQGGLLTSFISDEYDLPELVKCEYVRRGFNDHYLVNSGDERYFLRAYLNGKHYISGRDDFRFELELLRFLSSSGVPVQHSHPLSDVSRQSP